MFNCKEQLCCIFNYAPHYRFPIYKKMEETFPVHFYFGNCLFNNEQIEKLDYSKLCKFKKELTVRYIHILGRSIECTSGWLRLAVNSRYKQFLITPNQYALNQWLFLLLCFVLRKNVYVWMHGLRSKQIPRRALRIWKIYDYFVKGSFLYGNRAKENMIQLGFNPNKLHIIYNSLDFEESKKIRNISLQNPYIGYFQNNYPVLIFIGRMTAVKKLYMISEAVKLLHKMGRNVNVVFIGDGPERANLQKSMPDNLKERYWFVGSLYDECEIAKFLYYADLCVSPGNVGLTAIHAMSYGLPVITNDNFEIQMPEFEAIEQEKTGDFFKENDIADLADKIELWFANNPNREIVRRRCYDVIDTKYNPDYQTNLLKEVMNL